MLGYVAIEHIYFIKNNFLNQGKEKQQKKNCSLQNSAQCDTAQSQTPRSVIHFWICGKFYL